MKDHFLAACSHDFRSPLQGVLGYAELIIADHSLPEKHRGLIKKITRSGKQLQDMIESILDFSLAGNRPEDVKMIPLNLVDILDACISNVAASAEAKQITIDYPDFGIMPILTGHINALSRVFNNLLSNAVKFTPEGGQITLACIHNTAENCLAVSISDTGIGIPEEILPGIFDRYSKSSRKGTHGEKSTGLGLFITRQLVELHGGTITVNSRPNAGTCFTVTLPIAT
jgi:signal transduction histidine kinase